jgi:NAD-dependent SIR2 family protein deacetylase
MSNLNLKNDGLDAFPGSFFVYTSNVDNHSIKAGFHKNEVYEIHG